MDSARRRWCAKAGAALLALPFGVPAAAKHPQSALRIGLTAVILDNQVSFLEEWRLYLERRLDRPVHFIQRGSYRDITELMKAGDIDFAWVCGAPYVRNRAFMRLLAVPIFEGKPLYRSYLIVPADDARTRSLLDLRGRIFAYSDPDSNSGYLYTQSRLLELQERPGAFFGRTFFTWAHRNVVGAVRAGLADGGAVDGHVWETLARQHPALTGGTRIVERSPEFGYPPFVSRAGLSAADVDEMRGVLLAMSRDAEGTRLLARLNLDGFAAGDPSLFDGIARMVRNVGDA